MQQLFELWSSLDLRRKIILVLTGLGIFAVILGMARVVTTPRMALLYSGLENGQAGEVVHALEQNGAVFEVRGGAIYVDSASRDELRMTLASEGLPTNSTRGYELLDTLSGFGTTAQMFDAAYWRAKEGELARTIVGNRNISSARVHIANVGSNPFLNGASATASVTVSTVSGPLSSSQAKALRYLVASAVAGLSPADVSVIDGVNGLVGLNEDSASTPAATDRSADLRESVTRLLEARVGPGNAVVEVSIEAVTESESILERIFDPNSRVAISTDTEERSTSSRGNGGTVTIASNLPDGDATSGGESINDDSESRERVNYEVSETKREITREPGAIRRITVAVLVNAERQTTTDGTLVSAPRDPDELRELQDLVQSAIGFDADRGDVVTLKSMAFEASEPAGTAYRPSFWSNFRVMPLLQLAVLAIVAVILGVFVLRPLFLRQNPAALAAVRPNVPEIETAPSSQGLNGEIDPDSVILEQRPPVPALTSDGDEISGTVDPVERLRALIADRQEETVEILRSWLEDREKRV